MFAARAASAEYAEQCLCNSILSVLSARLSVSSKPADAGLLLWAGEQEISIDCCTAGAQQQRRAAGECGQCHVVSVRRKLNTDLAGLGSGLLWIELLRSEKGWCLVLGLRYKGQS